MARIRTRRQASRLRPVALERARQSTLHEGDEVFYGGICYGRVSIYSITDTKPYKVAILQGLRGKGMFRGCLAYAYPTCDEYEASGVHWNGPPRVKRRR